MRGRRLVEATALLPLPDPVHRLYQA